MSKKTKQVKFECISCGKKTKQGDMVAKRKFIMGRNTNARGDVFVLECPHCGAFLDDLSIHVSNSDKLRAELAAEREFISEIAEHLAIANANNPTTRIAHVLDMLVGHLAQPE